MKRVLGVFKVFALLLGILIFIVLVYLATLFFPSIFYPKKKGVEFVREFLISEIDIEIPLDVEMSYLYTDKTKGFMHGRRAMYAVFDFKERPNSWLEENCFVAGDNNRLEKEFYELMTEDFTDNVQIPREFKPLFLSKYYYISIDRIYLVYFENDCRLIVAVSGT